MMASTAEATVQVFLDLVVLQFLEIKHSVGEKEGAKPKSWNTKTSTPEAWQAASSQQPWKNIFLQGQWVLSIDNISNSFYQEEETRPAAAV